MGMKKNRAPHRNAEGEQQREPRDWLAPFHCSDCAERCSVSVVPNRSG